MATTFSRVKLGGGGYVADIDISPDGTTRLISGDTVGCSIWSTAEDQWKQLMTSTSMPVGERKLGWNDTEQGANCYEIKCAPSQPDTLYAVFPGVSGLTTESTVYKSTDRGATWVVQTNLTRSTMTVQDDYHGRHRSLAVHPTNPNIVLVGNSAGAIYRTADGGTSWALITGPAGAGPSIRFNKNDPTIVWLGWVTGTNRIYRSTDSGATFSQMTGGPDAVYNIACATDGIAYITANSGTTTNAWKLSGTTFTNLSVVAGATSGWLAVACDPFNAAKLTVVYWGGNINTSTDRGATWGGSYGSAPVRVATGDVTWLQNTLEDYMSASQIEYDPIVQDRLWFTEGIGVWYGTPPLNSAQPTWQSQTRGNDELITQSSMWVPSDGPYFTFQDRAIFRINHAATTTFPTGHGPNYATALRHGMVPDYAKNDTTFLTVACYPGTAYYSTNAGSTWTLFASQSPVSDGKVGGCMAALTSTNICWFPSNNSFVPSYTTNGGTSWATCAFPVGIPTTGTSGWGSSYLNATVSVVASGDESAFYAYNYVNFNVYKSTDGGANFTKVNSADVKVDAFGAPGRGQRIHTVPGQSGHLFLTAGPRAQGAAPSRPQTYPLLRSTDGGVTWSSVTGTQENWCIAIGKKEPSASYPTIYYAGYANNDTSPGVYRSIDNCATWTLLSANPLNDIDLVVAIAASPDTYGKFILAMSTTGLIMGAEAVSAGRTYNLQF